MYPAFDKLPIRQDKPLPLLKSSYTPAVVPWLWHGGLSSEVCAAFVSLDLQTGKLETAGDGVVQSPNGFMLFPLSLCARNTVFVYALAREAMLNV
jgi:hypothetical protein